MIVKFIGYSVVSEENKIIDQRIFLYDSELITEELALEMAEDPVKRAIFPNSCFDISISRLPFILGSFRVLKEIYSSITNESEELEEESGLIGSITSEYPS